MASELQKQGEKQPDRATQFGQFLEARKGSLAKVLSREASLTPDRLVRVAVTAMREKPDLLGCAPESVFAALMRAAELGLDPAGALGHAYLVRHGAECQLRVGYKGLVQLAHRGGAVSFITARLVRARDDYSLTYEPEAKLHHVPAEYGEADGDEESPPLVVRAYAAARLRSGELHVESMSVAQIERVRRRSPASSKGPWVSDWGQMARKTVLKRLMAYIPLSEREREALDEDTRQELAEPSSAAVTVDMPPPQTRTASVREKVRALPAASLGAAMPESAQEKESAERQPGED